MTLKATHNATSSPGSAAGASPCVSQAGPTTSRSGPEVAPASHSAKPDNKRGPLMPGTSGLPSIPSSNRPDLQTSLENRLRARLGESGSLEFAVTWKEQVMPLGRPICALLASARHTPGKGIIGWPTPVVSGGGNFCKLIPHKNHYLRPSGKKAHFGCDQAARLHAAGTNERGYAHPMFYCWLMGFPPHWTDMATPLSRKSRQSSSPPIAKSMGGSRG